MRIVRLGQRCNNACVFCAAASERNDADSQSGAVLDFDPTGETVALVGGEPTIYSELVDIARRLKSRGADRIVVQTNARRLAYGAYASSMADAGVDALDVSLHGSTVAMHDYHTGVEGSYVQTLRGAANAVSRGISVVVSTVVTRSNFRHLPELVQVARAAGASAIRFNAPHLSGRASKARDRVVAHPELVVPHLRRAVLTGRKLGLPVHAGQTSVLPSDFVPFVADRVVFAEPELARSGVGALPIVCRANPARSEERSRLRRTGAELRYVLPMFFEPASGGR